MKPLAMHLYKCAIVLACLPAMTLPASAQTENDGIMIPKNYICTGVTYSNTTWDHYWEGTFWRSNGNIGTFSANMYSIMGTYGITNNLIVTAGVPYVTTHASQGTLHDQTGIQDLTVFLKWRALKYNFGGSTVTLFAVGAAS
ncbi:MAG TPA: hypothetical protein VHC47_08345, partial [Mucilaginibacter sp.]|nr:hypothetical protein [Mucilaginibacter sp.]